jgi:single-strand DNA-binding protein
MPNLNRVTLVGHLGGDPETKPAGATTVTKFNLAVTDRWRDKADEKQEHTNWIPVSVWNGRGENLPNYIKKGSCVLVEGSLRVTSYDEAGSKRYFTEVVASNVVFLDKKGDPKKSRPRAVK